MKHQILVFFSSIFVTALSYSQSSFEIGVNTGIEFNFASSFNKEAVNGYEAMLGFNIGVRAKYNMGLFSILSGVEYGRMYIAQRPPSDLQAEKSILIANQARLPLLFQINIGKKRSQFFANMGPCFMITVADYDYQHTNVTFQGSWTPSVGKYPASIVQPFNIGGMAGAGYSYKLKPGLKLFTEVRMMIPFIPNTNNWVSGNNSIRTIHLSWQFGINFLIPAQKNK